MKKNLVVLLVFLSNCVFAQTNFNVTVPDNETLSLTNGLFGTISLGKNSKLFVYGHISVGQITIDKNGGGKISVSAFGEINVFDTIDLNGSDTIFNAGLIRVPSILVRNTNNYFHNIGYVVVEADSELNGHNNKILNEGDFQVHGRLKLSNLDEGTLENRNCAWFLANYIDLNSNNPFTGNGEVTIQYDAVFFNGYTLTNSAEINLHSNKIKPEKKWGAATINQGYCTQRSFPVEFVKTSFTREAESVRYELEVSKFSNVYFFTVEKSTDGKNWEEVLVPVYSDRLSKSYTGDIK